MQIEINTRTVRQKLRQYPNLVAGAAFGIGAYAGLLAVQRLFGDRPVKFETTVNRLRTIQDWGGYIHFETSVGDFALIPIKDRA